ncbi:MAG: outer membrane protein assembly factor BamA [Gemmatimonadota bacterium]
MIKGRTLLSLPVLASLFGVSAVPLRGQNIPRLSVRVDSIEVRGNVRHTATDIIERSRIRVGNTVQFMQIREAIQHIFATGDYSDVSISVTAHRPNIFFIDVVERPYVTRYTFDGLESLSPTTIRDSVGLAQNAPLEPDRVSRARRMILDLLANEGFPRARVDTSMARDPYRPDDLRITFHINEGPRLGIARIDFEGNESFPDSDLRGAMHTGEEGFLWFSAGELRREEYEKDLSERLPEYYRAHGYLDAAVLGDTLVVDPTTGKGRIGIRVSEGPQYVLEEFRIKGNRRFPTARLEELVRVGQEELPEGRKAVFNQMAFDKATADLGDLYRNAGYLRAAVIPSWEKLPPEQEGGKPRVIATWDINEGNPSYVRQVRIVGNTFTHDRVIRKKLLVFPGDVYSQQRLISTIQAIQGLGFFEPLPPQEAIEFRERPDGDIDLTFRVKEKQTGTLNFGVSAAAATGFAGFIGYEQPNLFGQAKVGRFRWMFGGRQQDIELTYSDPEVLGSRQSATISLRSSRDQFRTFSLGDRRQTGIALEVGTPLFGLRSTRVFLGYSIFRDRVRGLDTALVTPSQRQLITQGTRSALTFRVVRDTRNSSLFPTAGNRNSLNGKFTGGFLGGSGKYGKVELQSDWFVPVAQIGGGLQSNPIQFTAGISFNAGVIVGDNPFFLERFFMGGTQVGQQLRGYEEATVTPSGHIPRRAPFSQLDRVGESYFRTTALFGVKLTGNIFANAFMDAGNTWSRAADLNPTDLLVGSGLGVSLVTPFGPLGIDYAYGFDRRDVLGRPDPGWQLHFKFGRIF